jgi:arylsulfatase A-like enzyme
MKKNGKEIAAEDYAKNETIRFLKERPKDKPFAVTVAFYPPKPIGNSDIPGGQWFPKNETRALYNNITIPEPYNHSIAFKLLPDFLRRQRSAAAARWRYRYRTPLHYQEAMKNIYALITQVDQACKEIVDEVKRLGLYNNTMIIFTTDNGMFHGSHGLAGKWYPYQESIRVPLIIYDPRMPKEKVGFVDDSFTLNVDLAETILGAAGLKPTKGMQGRDISDLYLPNMKNGKTALDRKPWREEFFYEFTFMDENFIPSSNALVRKKWKFIDWYKKNHTQLFDLENDPLELYDVKNHINNSVILNEMSQRLNELRDALKEPEKGCDRGDYGVNALDPSSIVNNNNNNNTVK